MKRGAFKLSHMFLVFQTLAIQQPLKNSGQYGPYNSLNAKASIILKPVNWLCKSIVWFLDGNFGV